MSRRIDQLSWDQIVAAADAWRAGGSLALGLWASKNVPRFTVADYGALVQEVRSYLGDDTDYSQRAWAASALGEIDAYETAQVLEASNAA